VPGRGLRRIFAKIRTFAISASIRTRAETNAHVFDAFWRARARPGAQPHAHRTVPSQTRAPARARAYKGSQSLNRTPCSLSTSPERKFTCVCPAHGVPAAARAPTTVDRPTEPFPAQSDPRERDSTCLGETPRARNRALPRWRHRFRDHRTSPDRRRA
jgi:hypothetical protein